jgi:NADH-quinone oxidoreductase subunit N
VLALLFKIGGAPFHVWVPDVYEGSPTIITAFFAIVPKFAIMVSLVGLLFETFFGVFSNLQPFILGSALLSMVVASIGALNQTRMKRLFAYSAVGHGGFLLMGIGVGTYESLQAVLLYLIVYIIMSFVTFPLIFSVYKGAGNYIVEIINLSRNHPILGFTFGITLLSIAGVPPLAGFIGKFFVLSSAMDKGFLIGSVVAVLCSVISGFYYLRLVKQILFKDEDSFILKGLADSANPVVRLDIVRSSIMGLSFFLILSLMFYPNFLLYLTFDTVLFSFL